MEITRDKRGDLLLLSLNGRLDGYWATELENELDEWIRKGERNLRLDMSQVPFLSSAGIRVLVKSYKNLSKLNGSFGLINPSEFVKEVLSMSGLEDLCREADDLPQTAAADPDSVRTHPFDGMSVTSQAIHPEGTLRCRVIGDPTRLSEMEYTVEDLHTLCLPEGVFGFGLGAFGRSFEDCRPRFGEFVVAGGAAAYLPSDASNAPDFLLPRGDYVPEVQVLYAAICDGSPSHLLRFQPTRLDSTASLSQLVNLAFETVDAPALGLVLMAESAGLVGAFLKKTPTDSPENDTAFGFPEIRRWISYSPERLFRKSLALVTGVAIREPYPSLARMVRPVGREPYPAGHFHAATFSYRALHGEEVNLEPMVASLFEAETLQWVLHLLPDLRDLQGAGESEFVRGALWIGPIERSFER